MAAKRTKAPAPVAPAPVDPRIATYATAIWDTRNRHRRGCMARATYESHVASLWGTVGHLGIKAGVEAAIAARDAEAGDAR